MRYALIPLVLLLLVLWGRTAFYAVDQAEFVYVTRFGEPVAVHPVAEVVAVGGTWYSARIRADGEES